MSGIMWKRKTPARRGAMLIALLLLALSSAPVLAQPRAGCASATDCRQKAELFARRAMELRQQRQAKEEHYRQVQQRIAQPTAPKEVCRDTPQGRMCTRVQPSTIDERPQLREEIDRLSQAENDALNQANSFNGQARAFGQRSEPTSSPYPMPPPRGERQTSPVGKDCFIATAAYGSSMAEEVVVLRDFRDRHLLDSALTRSFVDFYYRNSPPLADYIASHEYARTAARAVLRPLIFSIKHSREVGSGCVLVLAAALLCAIGRRWRSRWPRR